MGEITLHNISSHLVLKIVKILNDFYDISYSCKTIRAKYYALQKLVKLYISFKKKGASMGWNADNYTFVMDDAHWSDLFQIRSNSYLFDYKSVCILLLLV